MVFISLRRSSGRTLEEKNMPKQNELMDKAEDFADQVNCFLLLACDCHIVIIIIIRLAIGIGTETVA